MPLPRLLQSLFRLLLRALFVIYGGSLLLIVWLMAFAFQMNSMTPWQMADDATQRTYAWVRLFALGFMLAVFAGLCTAAWRRKWTLPTFFAWLLVTGALLFTLTLLEFFAQVSGALAYHAGTPFLMIGVTTLGLAGLLAFARWSQWTPGRLVVLSLFLLSPMLAWLSLDETAARRPTQVAEIYPLPPRAEESWAVSLWYTPHDEHPAQRRFQRPPDVPTLLSGEPQAWPAYLAALRQRRAEIHATWTRLAPEREWIAALNAFPEIADLGRQRGFTDAPARLDFRPYLAVITAGSAEAILLADEGRGEDAVALLAPLAECGRKLETTPVAQRFYFTRLGLRSILAAGQIVLTLTPVPPAARAKLATAIDPGLDSAAALHRFVQGQYAYAYDRMLASRNGESIFWQGGAGIMLLFYNPHLTVNTYATFSDEIEHHAQHRDAPALEQAMEKFRRTQLKNFGGVLLLQSLVPDYPSLVKLFWETEDARAQLRAQLTR